MDFGDYLRLGWFFVGVVLVRRAARSRGLSTLITYVVLLYPVFAWALLVWLHSVIPAGPPPGCHAPAPGCLYP